MKVIGISGLARSGKDSFYEISKPLLKQMGIKHKRYAFADCLKHECDPFLIRNVNISAFTENSEEKALIRPFLVTYGTHIRRKLDENCWIDKINDSVKSEVKSGKLVFITDVRFPNEINWVHDIGGESIHITRKGISPPNEDETKNDPILREKSRHKITWEDFRDNIRENQELAVREILKTIIN
jgi:hypothetical protein